MEFLDLLQSGIDRASLFDFLVFKLLKKVSLSQGRLEIFHAHRLEVLRASLVSRYLGGSIDRFLTYGGRLLLLLLAILFITGLSKLLFGLHHALLVVLGRLESH